MPLALVKINSNNTAGLLIILGSSLRLLLNIKFVFFICGTAISVIGVTIIAIMPMRFVIMWFPATQVFDKFLILRFLLLVQS